MPPDSHSADPTEEQPVEERCPKCGSRQRAARLWIETTPMGSGYTCYDKWHRSAVPPEVQERDEVKESLRRETAFLRGERDRAHEELVSRHSPDEDRCPVGAGETQGCCGRAYPCLEKKGRNPQCVVVPSRRWGIKVLLNPWLSLGVHIDHTKPYVALHLPGCLILIGWGVSALTDEGEVVR